MTRKVYSKLVRDRIPEYIRSKGENAVSHVIPEAERLPAVLRKIEEEASELVSAPPEKRAEELADVLELLHAIADHSRIPWDDVLKIKERKRDERGGFENGIVLDYTG